MLQVSRQDLDKYSNLSGVNKFTWEGWGQKGKERLWETVFHLEFWSFNLFYFTSSLYCLSVSVSLALGVGGICPGTKAGIEI